MVDPTTSITTEMLRVVEKIREERWSEARRLQSLIGEHFERHHVDAHTAEVLAEKLHEVDELDAALMVLRTAWAEPKTRLTAPQAPGSGTPSSGFAAGDRVEQVGLDDVTFSRGEALTVVNSGDRFWMQVQKTPGGEVIDVRPSAYRKVSP